ncbi:MAG: MFS transporter [Gemmatimonadaceae bacterium]
MSSFLTNPFKNMRGGDLGRLSVLMFTAFIDMVGALMVIPLLPFYAEKLGANGFKIMVLVSVFSAMQLLTAPLWGRVSDRYGRKPALLIGLGASVIAYVVFAFAESYWLLLLSRIVQGAGGGTVGVIQAYVADAVEPKNRTRGLGWLSAATNAGVVLGPLLGSATTVMGPHAPGLFAAGLCALNIIFAFRFLTESHGVSARANAQRARTPLQAVGRVFFHPSDTSSRLIWIYSVAMGAFYGVHAILILFLNRQFGVTAATVGFFFAYLGGLSVLIRVFLLGPVVDRLGEARTSRLGGLLLAAGLATIPLMRPWEWLPEGLSLLPLALAVGLLPLGTAFTFPSVTALLSRVVGEHERGLYMGVQQTYGGIARVIYPLYAGFAWDQFGFLVPFWTSAVLVASTMYMGYGLQAYVHHAEPAGKKTESGGDLAKAAAATPEEAGVE